MLLRTWQCGTRSFRRLSACGVPPPRQCALPCTWRAFSAATRTDSVDDPVLPPKRSVPSPRPRPDLRDLKLGFVGWGAMAQAVSLGVLRAGLTDTSRVACYDVVPEVMDRARDEGLQLKSNETELVEWSDIVVVAVKPQGVDPVISQIAKCWNRDKILVSICAGVTINQYVQGLQCAEGAKVVRIMPNTPCLVAESATAYAGSDACREWELDLVHSIFAAVGRATHRVPEYLLNAVTGVSGSGPAYVYMLIQAMSDAGVHGGLPRNVALSLAAQTVIGAAKMVKETGTHPSVLKEAVTSPAGTTIAGVRVLEKMNFTSAVIEAVEAARTRSEELSRTPDFLFEKKSI